MTYGSELKLILARKCLEREKRAKQIKQESKRVDMVICLLRFGSKEPSPR
jgi:hypothetical protein